jgi:hypothetical protein
MSLPCGQRLVAGAVLVVFTGCSTASITRNYGPPYEAKITGSNEYALRVRDSFGSEFVIPREDVRDIDHPGNVLGTIGVVVAGVYARTALEAHDDFVPEYLGLIGMSIGIGLALGGLVPYFQSKHAARAFETANPVLPVPPPLLPFAPSAPLAPAPVPAAVPPPAAVGPAPPWEAAPASAVVPPVPPPQVAPAPATTSP